MATRKTSHKRGRRGANEVAARIVGIAVGDIEAGPAPDPKAEARGRASREAVPEAEERHREKAARARWGKRR